MQTPRHRVGVRRAPQPRAVLQHAHPRRGKETHLGAELSGLLAAVIEIFGQAAIEEHDGVANVRAVFRAAEAEHIHARLPGDFLRLNAE